MWALRHIATGWCAIRRATDSPSIVIKHFDVWMRFCFSWGTMSPVNGCDDCLNLYRAVARTAGAYHKLLKRYELEAAIRDPCVIDDLHAQRVRLGAFMILLAAIFGNTYTAVITTGRWRVQ